MADDYKSSLFFLSWMNAMMSECWKSNVWLVEMLWITKELKKWSDLKSLLCSLIRFGEFLFVSPYLITVLRHNLDIHCKQRSHFFSNCTTCFKVWNLNCFGKQSPTSCLNFAYKKREVTQYEPQDLNKSQALSIIENRHVDPCSTPG